LSNNGERDFIGYFIYRKRDLIRVGKSEEEEKKERARASVERKH